VSCPHGNSLPIRQEEGNSFPGPLVLVLPMKCLPIPGKKLNIVLMCHAINDTHTEMYYAYKKLCEMQCLKCISFSNILYGQYIMFHFIAI